MKVVRNLKYDAGLYWKIDIFVLYVITLYIWGNYDDDKKIAGKQLGRVEQSSKGAHAEKGTNDSTTDNISTNN